jgi:diguanylate cyclase (GGDEF)-like protein
MSPVHWRAITGPLITLALAGLILLSNRYLVRVPNLGALSFMAVAFSAYLGGTPSGLVSAAITIALAAVHFSLPGMLFQYAPDNLGRLLVVIACAPALAILMGILRSRTQRALEHERDAKEHERVANEELRPLRAALDQSEVGVVLLDSEMRAQFVNRAFRRLWRLPDEVAERKPAFAALMYQGRNAKAFAAPADQIDFIAEQASRIQAGVEHPVDIRLANGEVVRSRCKVLADGGRMVTYGNVSDLVRSAEEMAELAMKDALTGIFNRRHFAARLDGEWKRFRRYGRPLSLLLLDIDHFKSINDRYGHDIGDQVIIAVAKLCGTQTRDSDVAARIGGEEFALLLPETDLTDARIAAERLRVAVAERPLATNAGPIAVTVSLGAALADKAGDPAEFMKRADEGLYAAKRGGRNCVAAVLDDGPVVFNREARTAA